MGTLHHAHELFDGKEQRSRAIIISSYTTFAVRHGPAAIRKHRINKLAMSKTEADKIRFEADALWEGSLENCFDLVVNDECHLLKSLSADVSNSVLWLNALRYIMISATLIPNGISDWLGYMPFAEPFDADEWWSERSLAEMRFRDDEDPFSVPDEHVAAKLQLTVRAVKDWILTHRIDPAEQGFRMAKMWKKLVIRRTPQSRIPFGTGRKIADSLPRVKAAIINCSFNEEERGWYIESEKKLTGQLLVPGEGTKPAKWSLAVQRKLLLLTTWISLPNLDEIQNLKSTNMKRTFDEERFFLEWFTAHTKPSMENPGPLLQELLEGAPKLRALLRNVRSQVCTCFAVSMGVRQASCHRLPQQPPTDVSLQQPSANANFAVGCERPGEDPDLLSITGCHGTPRRNLPTSRDRLCNPRCLPAGRRARCCYHGVH